MNDVVRQAPRRRLGRLRARRPAGATVLRVVAGLVLAAIVLAGLIAAPLQGWLGLRGPAIHDPTAVNLFGNPTGPSSAHPLGFDAQGRDVLSRMLYGLRSMVLLGLAGAGLGVLAAHALAGLRRWGRLRPLSFLATFVVSALGAFPPLLLGLALAPRLGHGAWRLIVVLAISQLGVVAPSRRELPGRALSALVGAMTVDFALTFLGVLPGGGGPQLGAMVRQAGTGIVAGVPQWWALLFPGLVMVIIQLAHRALRPERRALRFGGPLAWSGTGRRFVAADAVASAGVRLVLVCGLAAVILPSVSAGAHRGRGGLAAVGSALAPTVSLLGVGAAVWVATTLLQVRLATRPGRLVRLAGVRARQRHLPSLRVRGRRIRVPVVRPGALAAALLAASPLGWLGFLALFLFSDSVGKLPVLPGAGGYVGLTHDVGRWAEALILPWLIIGLGAAARLAASVAQAAEIVARSGQQRVARAAGVPERRLSAQARRAVLAHVAGWIPGQLGWFLGTALILELTFAIPGAGGLTVVDSQSGANATVSDVTTLAAAIVVLAELLGVLAHLALDPGRDR